MRSSSSDHQVDLLVIGGGPGGLTAARFSKRRRPEWSVMVIRAQERSVVPCAMPYALDGTITVEQFLKSDEVLLDQPGIPLWVDHVRAVNPEAKTAETERNGTVHFDRLVLATGSEPIRPPIPGADLSGVFVVRDAPDIRAIAHELDHARRAVVIGAGYVGLEMAVVFHNRGLEVHVVEMLSTCLGNVCSEQIARRAGEELVRHGIVLHTEQMATALLGKNHVTGVQVDEEEIPADIVVFAIGVRANTTLAREAGLAVGRYGVCVDERLRTSAEDIYAVGDCIEFNSFVTGEVSYGPLATNAVMEGKVAAVNLTGGHRIFPGLVNPSVTRLFENSYGAVGLNVEQAQRAGMEVVEGRAAAHTRDKPFPGALPVVVNLVFRVSDRQLIGAEVMGGESVAERIDLLSFALLRRATVEDLATLHFTGHPPQTDVPARMPIVNAAEDAMRQMGLL